MNILHWFRNDLRLDDHRVLSALPADTSTLLCVVVLDDRWDAVHRLNFPRIGPYRKSFVLQSLRTLHSDLSARGNQLLVVRGSPGEVICSLATAHNIDLVTFEREPTSEEMDHEADVVRRCTSMGIKVASYDERTMIHVEDLPFPLHDLPSVFTSFRTSVERSLTIRNPRPACTALPRPPESLYDESQHSFDLVDLSAEFIQYADYQTPGIDVLPLDRLFDYTFGRQLAASYKETRNGLLGTDYSTRFSPYLSVGSLSPRRIYHTIRDFEHNVIANTSTYWIIFELLWRDFFRFRASIMGRRLFLSGGERGTRTSWKHDHQLFDKWKFGRTGQPFIDANMNELRQTGWMSNRGRQNVASYLTKTLGIDWRWGASWFESQLVDYDCPSNWGNWQYVAGVGADPREHRVFSLERQAAMYDPQGEYVLRWGERWG
ncbi:MAG TPA: DASH family cryptochrome [Chlorobiota bacterium]|nr:DASH family cryptochrome [Chlorobiota bacterium]